MHTLKMKQDMPTVWRPRLNGVKSLLAFLALLLLVTWGAPTAAADEPAVFTGGMTCPAKYPGTKRDLTTGLCWSCPSSQPNRTVFTVTGNAACEKPAHETYKKPEGPRNPKGFLKTDCDSGWFLDIGKGKCYKCPTGYNRSAHAITHSRACSKRVPLSRVSANLPGSDGCEPGSFQHGLTGKCYACPTGTRRNLRMGNDPSQFDACTRCGSDGDKPCTLPIVPSCDAGLKEDLLQGICVPDDKAKLRAAADRQLDKFAEGLFGKIKSAVSFSEDEALQNDLRSENQTNVQSKTNADINPCVFDEFNAWTLGAVAEGAIILGAAVETGMSVDISKAGRTGNQRLAEWYGGASYSLQLGGGATGGLNFGCWRAQNNDIGGDTHGIVFDAKTIAERLGAKIPTTPASILIGVWFNPHGNDINFDADFQGITITPVYSKGADLTGISYVKGTVGQVGSPKTNISGVYKFVQADRKNEFKMIGTDRLQVRAYHPTAGAWQIYNRTGPRKFKAANSNATYEIEANGDLVWKGSTTIRLTPTS